MKPIATIEHLLIESCKMCLSKGPQVLVKGFFKLTAGSFDGRPEQGRMYTGSEKDVLRDKPDYQQALMQWQQQRQPQQK